MTADNIRHRIEESANNLHALSALAPLIESAAAAIITALQNGNKIIFCGNGGSAADSQHLAAELMGRFMRERPPLAAMALTVDTSLLTAVANDYGYAQVFERQLAGIGQKGDVLVALSTSGNSANVIAAARTARQKEITVLALTGNDGGQLAKMADIALLAPAQRTDLIQELHIVIGHILCGLAEDALSQSS